MKYVCTLNINYTVQNRTTKLSSEQFEAFSSMNYPHLAESGVHLHFRKHLLFKSKGEELIVRKNMVDDIVVLKLFPGISKNVSRKHFKYT